MIVKNLPTFVAGLSGVGGFRNYGAEAAVMAINAGMTGAGHLAKTASTAGGLAQGIGQFGKAFTATAAASAAGTHSMSFMKGFAKFTAAGAKHVGAAGLGSVKDPVMRQNTHQSFGQKFNQHLANRVKKRD